MNNNIPFNDFCDKMMIVEEGLDTIALDGFGDEYITLYHASPLELKVIQPNSWNMGNRLSPRKRKSSFWTNNIQYSILWSLDWVALRIQNLRWVHDIEKYKFYIPKGSAVKEGKNGEIVDRKSYTDCMLLLLREDPVYVYEAKIPRKIVSKGQYNIDEYTVDVPIKPDKRYVVTDKEAKGIIEEMDVDRFISLYKSEVGDIKKLNPRIRELLIFKNPKMVVAQRRNMYKKETSLYGHALSPTPVTESWDSYFIR